MTSMLFDDKDFIDGLESITAEYLDEIQESLPLTVGGQNRVIEGPPEWFDSKHTAEDAVIVPTTVDFTSKTIRPRTLRARIHRFGLIEGEDYTITIGKHGLKTYHIAADMAGWVNRRLP